MVKSKLNDYEDRNVQSEFENVYNEFTLFSAPTYTSAERDELDPENGQVIYNSEASVHQGYNGSWNNLY